jgi:carboxypeptidase D
MNHRHWILSRVAIIMIMVTFTCAAQAARIHKNMTASRLAEVELITKDDLRQIDEAGGIIDQVTGDIAQVYLLPEDFDKLRLRGFEVRWIQDVKTEFLQELWERTRGSRNPLDDYHTNDEIQSQFAAWQLAYPTLFHYESLGLSVQGRNLWACKISDNVNSDESEIEVKYISTMHGNENVGTENCIRFAEDLLLNYGINPDLTALVNDFEIWMLPMMNPDGNAVSQRWNANGVDLNRDFPDRCDDSVNTTTGRQIETALVMNWSAARNFVLSANFHTGALVVNYPWDNNCTGGAVYTPTQEDALFIWVSRRYCEANPRMRINTAFMVPDTGITNGADWYEISGGMQDWNYVWMGDKEVTIELDTGQPPPSGQLEALWQENRYSMRYYFLEAKYGVRGIVTDSTTGLPLRASIRLSTIPYLTYSSALNGDYFRILQNGIYSLTYSAPGYQSKTYPSVAVSGGVPTILDVQLARVPSPVVSTSPDSITASVGICDSSDVAFTILNTGEATLTWSAVEAYESHTGYGSATGGGWRFMDSDHSGGPTYNWVDIGIQGTAVTFSSDDQNLGPFAIGFNFPYYGSIFSTFRISANGWISFTSSSTAYVNTYLPDNGAPENLIAPWWDDLSPHRVGTIVRRYTNNADSLIVSFQNVQSYSGSGLYNFELILLASGKILFQYANMGSNRLNSSTIGIQNSVKDKGSTVVYNALYIHNNMAISFCPNSMIALLPASGSVPPQSSQIVVARLKSCCVPNGLTNGTLAITSNDPVTPLLNVPVTIDVSLPPDPVTDLSIIVESSDVRLRWSPTSLATYYKIYRSSMWPVEAIPGSFVTDTSDTTYLDTSVGANTAGYYIVIAAR